LKNPGAVLIPTVKDEVKTRDANSACPTGSRANVDGMRPSPISEWKLPDAMKVAIDQNSKKGRHGEKARGARLSMFEKGASRLGVTGSSKRDTLREAGRRQRRGAGVTCE